MATRKRGETAERRNLEQFLGDQKRFDDMKKQKLVERKEEDIKSQMSQTVRQPYMN
jgi:hypothetical protein